MFDHIPLQPEQKELLSKLVEASRNVPTSQRQKFILYSFHGDGKTTSFVDHPGLDKQTLNVYKGDVEALVGTHLLTSSYTSRDAQSLDVTPLGFQYYEYLMQQIGEPIQRVEAGIKNYLEPQAFQAKYPVAYQKWSAAEEMLWSAESERQLTTIGHLCREAIQEFATALVEKYQPTDVDKDKAHDIVRIRSVLQLKGEQLGSTEKPFLDALLSYWKSVSALVQRQEHGGQREGSPLIWEDGRRVVFHTAIVIYEIDHVLSRGA